MLVKRRSERKRKEHRKRYKYSNQHRLVEEEAVQEVGVLAQLSLRLTGLPLQQAACLAQAVVRE